MGVNVVRKMEKRLRSSLHTSADEFLSSAAKLELGFKSSKSSLKALIHSLDPSSSLSSSLPLSLHHSISQSITRFRHLSQSPTNSPPSPPTKRIRRSSRHSNNGDDDSSKNHNESQKLQIYTYVALLCVSHPKEVFSPSDLLPAVRELHDNLTLFESESALLLEIASLCEEWWKSDLPGKETLISQTFPFLVSRSLTLKKKVDVHRVYLLREGFTLFDFDDESIEDLKILLIRCSISPLYLKTEDGRKFIAFMFGLSGQLLKESLAMIRSQIPFGRKSMLESYSDIVFRAWKVGDRHLRNEIEDGFLQGLIEGAIHASSASFAASIRRVFGGFITHRTDDGVEKLLFRLAEPLIFRSLQVANSNVRQNALHLLVDMFPLEDPDCTKEVKDTLLDKQFFLLEKLLMDQCPDVRVVAVEGCCRILHLFWEIIPSSTIAKIITKIFDDMSHDACNEVRLSTLNGITYLLGNPRSHEILKVLLPRMGHLILDPAISIRTSLLDLLLLSREIRSFQFHKVVGLDVLLSTLANDQPLIAQKITKLLMPSYFPSNVAVEEACNRCVTLTKRSPMAGARFCEFALVEGASLHSLLELVKVFISLALSPNEMDGDQLDGLLVGAAYICNNLVSEASYKASLKELLSVEKLRCLFGAVATRRAQSSVCDIISCISPDDIGSLFEECMALLTNCCGLSENTERQVEVRSAQKMILSCNWFDEMFETLTWLLQKTAHKCHTKFGTDIGKDISPSAKRRKVKSFVKFCAKRKQVSGKKSSNTATSTFEDDYSIALGIAWQIKDLLLDENTRRAMLESQVLEVAFFALKAISDVSVVQSMHCDYMDTSSVFAYTALTLHMSLQNVSINGANNQETKKKASTDSGGSSLEPTLLEQTMDHLFNCTNKIFGAGDTGSSNSNKLQPKRDRNKSGYHCGQPKESDTDTSSPSDGESTFSEKKRISNTVKILTAVLKFIVDATAMGLNSYNCQGKCLKFSLNYAEFIMSNLRQQSCDKLQFKEEDFKEAFLCLKSSFTYAAKLLNLTLASSNEASLPPPETHDLANSLLDLIVLTESCLGTGYAARVVSAMKPWLPDLILALGSMHMQKQGERVSESETEPSSNRRKSGFPSWLSVLAKIEINEIGSDEDGQRASEPVEFPAFKKLVESLILRLRGNSDVLDAVGVVFLTGVAVGLERKDFEMVFGLLHFISVKLVKHERGEWGELKLMLASLRDIYPRIEREEEVSSDEDEKQMLRSAIILLEPVWMSYIYGNPLEEE